MTPSGFNKHSITQVTAKPELYPLVLSYNMDGNKITNGSYYVVQQFRNYLINPLSSLSGTSNEEALGSNLLDDTISDTNPAPPSYTLVPDNSVIIQNEVQTSTSLLDNLTQSIPEEEGEQNAEEEEDKTTESETAPLNPSGSQLFAHFNSNVSRFSSKHKRYSSIIVTPNQSTQSIRRSYSAPPTPSTSILPNFPSSHSGNATSENPAPLFVPPVCTVISEQPVAGAFFVPPVIPEQPVDTSSQCDVTSEHPVPERQEHPMPQCNIISVLPVGSAICEHPVVDL
ncbi:hypothetical protein M8J76_013378 [Diaphorina citri]|nr:hypothetical protein M8J76_013378 [Diaphorina citri]